MKKIVLSVVAALAASAAPALAADMPVKAPMAPVAVPSPWDIAFGTALTTDYELRGITQSAHKPAVQGYFELDYTASDWLKLYTGVWGSSINFAEAEFDISGGGRFSWGNFGLDLGFVYYAYPNPGAAYYPPGSNISYGEFYAKPSYKVTDWLSVGASIIGGNNFSNTGEQAIYYAGNATVTLPQFLPYGIATSISGELGRQTYASVLGLTDYTTWNVGVSFNYKAVTLDLRYWDTNVDWKSAPQCANPVDNIDACDARFVATLKFDTTLSALK